MSLKAAVAPGLAPAYCRCVLALHELYRVPRQVVRNAFSDSRARHLGTEPTYGGRVFRFRCGGAADPEIELSIGASITYGAPEG